MSSRRSQDFWINALKYVVKAIAQEPFQPLSAGLESLFDCPLPGNAYPEGMIFLVAVHRMCSVLQLRDPQARLQQAIVNRFQSGEWNIGALRMTHELAYTAATSNNDTRAMYKGALELACDRVLDDELLLTVIIEGVSDWDRLIVDISRTVQRMRQPESRIVRKEEQREPSPPSHMFPDILEDPFSEFDLEQDSLFVFDFEDNQEVDDSVPGA